MLHYIGPNTPLEQRREELAEKQETPLVQRLARHNAALQTRILGLENECRGLRLVVHQLLETICELKGGEDCDQAALARGFDETGGT